jgi:DNA-binding NarL/FixJ family response regulator
MTGRARILFVDDVKEVLDGLAGSVWRYRKTWHPTFALGGASAVTEMRKTSFDVIVTDMRMPVVDGEAVLNAAATYSPSTIRIILSGQIDRAISMRTTSIAHRFMSKPCRIEELYDCVEEVLRVATAMDTTMRSLVCGVGQLPVAIHPTARSDEGQTTDQLVAAVTGDAGLAAHVLHAASSGFFAKRQRVSDLREAVTLLGNETVRTLIRAIKVTSPSATAWNANTMDETVGRIAMSLRPEPALDHVAVGRNLLALWGITPELPQAL